MAGHAGFPRQPGVPGSWLLVPENKSWRAARVNLPERSCPVPALALPWAVLGWLLSLHIPHLLPPPLPRAQLPKETQLSPRLCYCRWVAQNLCYHCPSASLALFPPWEPVPGPASQDIPWLIMSHSLEPCSSFSCLVSSWPGSSKVGSHTLPSQGDKSRCLLFQPSHDLGAVQLVSALPHAWDAQCESSRNPSQGPETSPVPQGHLKGT